MKILVIGGTRFIGPWVVRSLINAGHELMIFHRGTTTSDIPTGIRELLGDRAELEQHRKDLLDFDPQIIIDMIVTTAKQVEKVIDIFGTSARRLVLVSSQDVYRAYGILIGQERSAPIPVPMDEESPLRTRLYPYRGTVDRLHDYDKIPAEQLVMSHSRLAGTVLRLPMVYGPNDYQHRLHTYLKRMDDGRRFILVDDSQAQWRWSTGYVENVAHAISVAAVDSRAVGRIFNVADPDTLTIREWISAVGTAAGWNGKIMTVPGDLLPDQLKARGNVIQDLWVSTDRIRNELDFSEPIGFHEGLKRTVEWERAHPPTGGDQELFDYEAEDRVLARLQDR